MNLDKATIWFIVCASLVAYTYLLYPVTVALLASFLKRPSPPGGSTACSVSILVAVYNEVATIRQKIHQLARALERAKISGEIIIVSDGSTDGTIEQARGAQEQQRIRVIERTHRGGKAEALNDGVTAASGDIIVLADARQHWPDDSVLRLLAPFHDPQIGAASGDLVLANDQGKLEGVGLYWRFEKWLRRNESRLHSTVGVSGSIAAVRRSLFPAIPPGTILDDVYWPLKVVMQGYRVVHVADALAYDRLPTRRRDEFRRKIRTLSGNFQLVALLPTALLPWRNPICVQFVSHKILRLIVPWALIVMLLTSLLGSEPWLRILFGLQLLFYGLGVVGLFARKGTVANRLSPISSFLLLNASAWIAFWAWLIGSSNASWAKTEYRPGPN